MAIKDLPSLPPDITISQIRSLGDTLESLIIDNSIHPSTIIIDSELLAADLLGLIVRYLSSDQAAIVMRGLLKTAGHHATTLED